MLETLYLKRNDLQPYYYFTINYPNGNPVDITGSTIYCTMRKVDGTLKINRQTAGINITDGLKGEGEYRWQSTDTNEAGTFYIEFEVNPPSSGKFTSPVNKKARVIIGADEDAV